MRYNRMLTWLVLAAAMGGALVIAGVSLAWLLPFALVLACPLMMILMMMGKAPGGKR